jgi:hypothetical protein
MSEHVLEVFQNCSSVLTRQRINQIVKMDLSNGNATFCTFLLMALMTTKASYAENKTRERAQTYHARQFP